MKQFLQEIFKDKNNRYSVRELTITLILIALIISWIAAQFFNRPIPDSMFFTFASLIAAGCFGYSLEKPQAGQQ